MAVRKATMKQQLAEAVSQVNPGDRVHGTVVAVTGPSPWLIGLLGLFGQMIIKYYFVTVTDQAVLFHRVNRMTGRPREIAHAIPRAQFPGVGDVRLNPLWSWFRTMLPGDVEPTRMNVGRQWKPELEQLLPLLGGAAQQPPAPQYAPPPPQIPQQQAVPPQYFAPQQSPYVPAPPPYGAPQQGNPYAG